MIKVEIDTTQINSSERLTKLKLVQIEMTKVINSEIFREKVLNIRKDGELSEWKNKTNLEIYERIISGSESLDENKDNVLNILLVPYFSFKKVIGYTYPNQKQIYFNTRYFDQRSTKLIGSTCLHEYSHKLGFHHDFRRTSRRKYSLSYELNRIYEESYDLIYGVVKKSKVRVCSGIWPFKKCKWVLK